MMEEGDSPDGSIYVEGDGEDSSVESSHADDSMEDDLDQGKQSREHPDAPLREARKHNDASSDQHTGEWRERLESERSIADKYDEFLSQEYRDLEQGLTAAFGDGPFAPSQIGASFWTSEEKDTFFHALSIYGPGDLATLSRAVRTKSQLEVRAYIVLLQEGATMVEEEGRRSELVTYADIPSACEISAECEAALDCVVDQLEVRDHSENQVVWMSFSPDLQDCIIDEEAADEIEHHVQSVVSKTDGSVEPGSEAKAESALDITDHSDIPNEPRNAASFIGGPTERDDVRSTTPKSMLLLRPLSFVQLSRSLFMNGNINPETRFDRLFDRELNWLGPALERTALDEMYNLAVSVTRRLVQTAIFQATARLRATEDSRTQPRVRKADVETALRVLGMKPGGSERERYFASAVKQYGVDVYSASTRFKDGRPESRYGGFKLTEEEISQELGIMASISGGPGGNDEVLDIDDFGFYSDDFTEAAPSDSESSRSEQARPSIIDQLLPKRRWRSPSPVSKEHAEDLYLEMLDRRTGLEEERKLRQMLELDNPNDEQPFLAPLKPKHEMGLVTRQWRDINKYEAEWERNQGIITDQQFTLMDELGERGRKRRKVFRDQLSVQYGDEALTASRSGEINDESTSPVVSTESEDTQSQSDQSGSSLLE